MNERNRAPERDDVLFAFHQSCERPTAMQVVEWTNRYPEFADDIRAHAAVRLDCASQSDDSGLEPDETMFARGRSRALNAVYDAQRNTAVDDAASDSSWSQILSAANFTIPQLAKSIRIDRMVLAEFSAGRMRMPLGVRLLDALMRALNVTNAAIGSAAAQLLTKPHLGHAKADQHPTVLSRSYEEVIRASSMSDEEKAYWLSED